MPQPNPALVEVEEIYEFAQYLFANSELVPPDLTNATEAAQGYYFAYSPEEMAWHEFAHTDRPHVPSMNESVVPDPIDSPSSNQDISPMIHNNNVSESMDITGNYTLPPLITTTFYYSPVIIDYFA